MSPFLTKSCNTVLTIIIVPVTLFPLCLLLLVRLVVYMVNLCSFYFYRHIGKLTETDRFLATSGVQLSQTNFHFLRTVFSSQFKSKVGNILAKAEELRINSNIDGSSIPSRSHTRPSHTQNSHLLTSSLSLGVPVPHSTQCIRDT